jgi:nucleotide-binding universal stress UspA family protein
MYRRILVGLDGSAGSQVALRKAVLLTAESQARLHALAVEEHLPRFAATVGEVEEARHEKDTFFNGVLATAKQVARKAGVELETKVAIGNAAKVIVEHAREMDVDLIVLGHTRSVWGNLLGATADRVVDHAHCDVLVVR